jgi:hypothetical protein
VTVVDARSGAVPERLAELELPSPYGRPSIVELVRDRLCVATDGGLFVVDVSDPSRPTVKGHAPGLILDAMAAGDGVLFAAAGGGESDTVLLVIDTAGSGEPRVLASVVIDTNRGMPEAAYATAMSWSDQRLLVALDDEVVRLYDVSVPVRPVLLQQTRTPSRVRAMAVTGCQAVLACGDGGVLLMTLTAGVLPTMRERAYLPLAEALARFR